VQAFNDELVPSAGSRMPKGYARAVRRVLSLAEAAVRAELGTRCSAAFHCTDKL
jgi:hypothetical protein